MKKARLRELMKVREEENKLEKQELVKEKKTAKNTNTKNKKVKGDK